VTRHAWHSPRSSSEMYVYLLGVNGSSSEPTLNVTPQPRIAWAHRLLKRQYPPVWVCESAEPLIRCGADDPMHVETPLEIVIVLSSEVMQELRRLVRAELVQLNLSRQATRCWKPRIHGLKLCPAAIAVCAEASVPSTSLFCPKCDSFQGTLRAERCLDDRS